MMTTERRKLTEPLGTVTTIFGILLLGLSGAAIVMTLFGSGAIGGFGHGSSVCATQRRTLVSGDNWTDLPGDRGLATRPGAALQLDAPPEACASHPSITQRVLYTLTSLPSALLWGCILLLLYRLIRAASRGGPFTRDLAVAMRRLGWVILIGNAVVTSAQGAALDGLLNTLFKAQNDFADAIPLPQSLAVPLLVGAALLTFARIIRVGAAMNEDLQGTV